MADAENASDGDELTPDELKEQLEQDHEAICQNDAGDKSVQRFQKQYKRLYQAYNTVSKEADRAWKIVETAKKKEDMARKIIKDLEDERDAKNQELANMPKGGATDATATPEDVKEDIEGGNSNKMYIIASSVAAAAIGAAAFFIMRKS